MRNTLIGVCVACALALPAMLVLPAAAQTARAPDTRSWLFDDSSDVVTLQYGTPESDDVVISVSCEANSRTMRITEFAGASSLDPGRTSRLRLTSGTATLEYTGQALSNEMDGGVNLEVAVPPDAKLFALLKAGPLLTIDVAGKQVTVPLKGVTTHLAALEKVCLGRR